MSTPMPQRFPYVEVDPILGSASALPYAPITVQLGDRKVQASGLIDSGSTLNVLPSISACSLAQYGMSRACQFGSVATWRNQKRAVWSFLGRSRDSRRSDLPLPGARAIASQ